MPASAGTARRYAEAAARPAVLLLGLLLLPVSGCVSFAARNHHELDRLVELERKPSLDPAAIEDADVLVLGKDAQRFIRRSTAHARDTHAKLQALRNAVFAPDGLDFRIDDSLTLPAEQAYRRASGNCLSLANFFVAAARYLGVDAEYQAVRRQSQRTEKMPDDRDFYLVELHVNVSGNIRWGNRRARYVLDYLAVPEEDLHKAKIITDRRALAHYYNNLAVRRLGSGNLETALQYLKKAILTDAGVDFIWSNLGVVYSRRGDLGAAELAYEHALTLNRDHPSALRNLASLRAKMRRRNHDGDPRPDRQSG